MDSKTYCFALLAQIAINDRGNQYNTNIIDLLAKWIQKPSTCTNILLYLRESRSLMFEINAILDVWNQ